MISVIRRHRRTIRWAVDLTNGPAAMLIAVLLTEDADLRYVSGSFGARLAQAFHGEQKTDAKDALVIAQTIRRQTHRQAAAALSRRRVDVPWACIRDGIPNQPKQPTTPYRTAAVSA